MRYRKRIKLLPVLLLTAFALLFAAPTARAEMIIVPSVEWLVCQAERVVTGTVELVREVKGEGDIVYRDCRVRVSQTFKGKSEATLEFSVRDMGDERMIPAAALSAQHEFLLLLATADPEYYTHEERLRNRLMPVQAQLTHTVIDLSAPLPDRIFSKDMVLVADRERLLEIVRNWAGEEIKYSLWAEAPFDSVVFHKIYAGSICGLFVPADRQYYQRFLKACRNPASEDRSRSALLLRNYPGTEAEQVLLRLLDDPQTAPEFYQEDEDYGHRKWQDFYATMTMIRPEGEYWIAVDFRLPQDCELSNATRLRWVPSGNDTLTGFSYPVRIAARSSLEALGVKPPEVILFQPATSRQQEDYADTYWRAAFAPILANYGQILSVRHGRAPAGNVRPEVLVTFTVTGNDRCVFSLIPGEWKPEDNPPGQYLGQSSGVNGEIPRRIFLRGPLPDVLREKIITYFELQPEQ